MQSGIAARVSSTVTWIIPNNWGFINQYFFLLTFAAMAWCYMLPFEMVFPKWHMYCVVEQKTCILSSAPYMYIR